MSENMTTMAQRIAKEVHRNDLLVTDIYVYILDAVKYYRNEVFFQSEGWFNFNTIAVSNPGPSNFIFPDQHEVYRMPRDFIEMLGITVLFNGTALPLNVRELDWYLEQCQGNPAVVGPPTDYMLYNGQVFFWPLPDQVYPCTIWYKRASAPPSLYAPTDIGNFWMTDEREVMIRSAAKALLYAQRLRDQKNAQIEESISAKFYQKMCSSSYGNLFTGSPKSHDW